MFTLRAVFRLNHLIKLMSDVSFTLCIGSLQESRQTEQKMEKQTKWEEIEMKFWCFVWWNMWIHSKSVALLARNTKWQIIKTSGFTKKNIRKNINEQLKCLSNKKTCAEIRARHDFNSAEKETMFNKSFEFKLWVWDEWIEERRRLVHLFAHN